jgi:hypothetical protein
MGWFSRRAARLKRSTKAAVDSRSMDTLAVGHLTEFVQTRRGIEAFIEPQTSVTQTTILLVAYDGEWTRRTIPSEVWGHKFAEHLQIPGYDAAVVGYPQRMRDYNSRKKRER